MYNQLDLREFAASPAENRRGIVEDHVETTSRFAGGGIPNVHVSPHRVFGAKSSPRRH